MTSKVPESNALTHTLPHEPAAKPPTQVAGVIGIESVAITMNEAPAIDWERVVQLPPFQMFVAEKARITTEADSMEHAAAYVRAHGAGQDLFDQYAAWHLAKAYWPNETPLGQAKE